MTTNSRPWRMAYEWANESGSPIRGTTTHHDERTALDAARRQAAIVGPGGNRPLGVTVAHRDGGPVTVIPVPDDDES